MNVTQDLECYMCGLQRCLLTSKNSTWHQNHKHNNNTQFGGCEWASCKLCNNQLWCTHSIVIRNQLYEYKQIRVPHVIVLSAWHLPSSVVSTSWTGKFILHKMRMISRLTSSHRSQRIRYIGTLLGDHQGSHIVHQTDSLYPDYSSAP